jgi:hypothetical protein
MAGFMVVASTSYAGNYMMSGNLRGQIGDGLPIPILLEAAPKGPIFAGPSTGLPTSHSSTMITQSPGPSVVIMGTSAPRKMFIPEGVFKFDGALNLPVNPSNDAVFQVQTDIEVYFPDGVMTLSANGRSGPPTVSWCPGNCSAPGTGQGGLDTQCTKWTGGPNNSKQTVGVSLAGNNPGCQPVDAQNFNSKGRVKYKKTTHQFGGSGVTKIPTVDGVLQAYADVGFNVPGNPPRPCDWQNLGTKPQCIAAFGNAKPERTGIGKWNDTVNTIGTLFSPGIFNAKISFGGNITSISSIGLGPGILNAQEIGAGGPLTTGIVYVTAVSTVDNASETFRLSGSDNRDSHGIGTISLVGGSVANRTVSGPNANRAWLNMTIKSGIRPVPGLSPISVLVLVGLVGGATLFLVRRAIQWEA